jgi:uncharacterized membrane protein
MKSTLLSLFAGLLLGVIIHIVSILTIPWAAEHNAWSRLTAVAPVNEVRDIAPGAGQETLLPDIDPTMRYAVCHYDLDQGVLQIRAPVPRSYWSLALYDRLGINYYVINDRVVGAGDIEVWVANAAQLLEIEPEGIEESEGEKRERLVVGAPRQQGFAVFRVLAADSSLEQTVRQVLAGTSCATLAPSEEPGARS